MKPTILKIAVSAIIIIGYLVAFSLRDAAGAALGVMTFFLVKAIAEK